ncbi:MAG: PPC domain-containing protein [Spirochaetes bacterium]|nr:PPC domain-containing protein [Spirochaetota bacterium]
MKIKIFLFLLLVTLFIGCSQVTEEEESDTNTTIEVTITNTTGVTTGTLYVTYGDGYTSEVDNSEEFTNLSFPFKLTINSFTSSSTYACVATLDSTDNLVYDRFGDPNGYVVFDTTKSGTIEATLDLVLEPVPVADSYESDNNTTDAKTITSGETQNRSLHVSSDIDYIKFEASAGNEYTFETILSSNRTDTVMYLYDSSNNELADNDDYNNLESRIDYSFTTAGTYYLKVIPFDNEESSIGDYLLRVTAVSKMYRSNNSTELLLNKNNKESWVNHFFKSNLY